MSEPNLKDCKRVLIVEGYSDLRFYAEMLENLGKHEGLYIKQFGGKSNVATQLRVFLTSQLLEEKTHIGVIVDADKNPENTFRSIQSALAEATGLEVSSSGGWVGDDPRIGAFIAPDSCSPGEIETLVWRAWSSDSVNSQAKVAIEAYAQQMKEAGFEAKSPEKGLIGSLLAIRNDDDPRLGPGAQARVFDLANRHFAALREFLAGF